MEARGEDSEKVETAELEKETDQAISLPDKDAEHKTKELRMLLSDAGIYSYAAICALSLHELFDNEWDQKFNLQCIKLILNHLRLPKQVEGVMLSLIEGQGNQSPGAYIELLLSEPPLNGKAVLVIEDLIMLAVHGGEYDARMRVLIRHIAKMLDVPLDFVDLFEESAVEYLTEDQKELTEDEKKELNRRQRTKKIKRYALIGLATLGGGAVLGLTGGLAAAPLLGAGMGTLFGGASAAAIGSTAGIAIIGSLFGVAGAGLTGFKMRKRVGEIEEFAFGYLTPSSVDDEACDTSPRIVTQQLHITIAISGWLSDDHEDNFIRPWRSLFSSREQYYLRYESTYLLELGKAMDLILSFAVSMAAQEALKYTILAGLINAIAWPSSLITLASVIDNPWGVCCRRSAEVGKQLAEVLLSREQGQRPVTLIGFSLGARVIYYCLREMSQRDRCEGIIQDAILLGTPVTGAPRDWQKLMRVVSGKIVNGYCRSDWLLKFLYRTLSISSEVAGLQPIDIQDRRMCNIDLSDIVSGHGEYPEKIDAILKTVGVRTRDDVTHLESRIKKSSSDLPGSEQAKISLLSLRPSKSDKSLHQKLSGDESSNTDSTSTTESATEVSGMQSEEVEILSGTIETNRDSHGATGSDNIDYDIERADEVTEEQSLACKSVVKEDLNNDDVRQS
ncbi:transmembrane and coiled-coil domain-containing protein 4-like isoform X1 [Periplaneta americana]|uniref:transmembrane and coiled-coil domain-containing protein 4-like isoform X1 n=1 Tax=Periplaneta americana TaxID=6978 RepID=UPI0037E70F75